MGKFLKSKISKEHVDAIQANMSEFRTKVLYKLTTPWDHKGEYLLPVCFYKETMNLEREYSQKHESLVINFLNNWESYKVEAKQKLNGLFNPADYPSLEKVTKKFKWSINFQPVPASGNFKIELAEQETNELISKLAANNDQAVKNAMASVWQRVFDAVKSLSEKMKETRTDKTGSDVSPIFRNSIIENIKELIDILPGLNITNDPALIQAAADLLRDIANINPDVLRENKELRKETADKADTILNKIGNLF